MVDTFPIVPGDTRGLWILTVIVGIVMALGVLVLVAATRGARHSSVEVSAEGLRLRGDLYGRLVPARSLNVAGARVVDLDTASELVPRRRTVGTALPGYRSGWFRLRNGEKALLYLTDPHHAVYVPTTEGYSLLLSPEAPDRFVDRLRALATR